MITGPARQTICGIGLADVLLGRTGRLIESLGRFYGRQLRTRPDLADVIHAHRRGAEVAMAA